MEKHQQSISGFSSCRSRERYLDALQPPPEGVAAVVASAAALAQQVGDQPVAQRSSEGQDDVAASKRGSVSSCGCE